MSFKSELWLGAVYDLGLGIRALESRGLGFIV